MKQITLLLTLIVFFVSSLSATTLSTVPSADASISEKKLDLPAWKLKLIEKFEKKVAKISKKDKPEAGDNLLAKDAKWWLKIWLLCWAGGLLFSVLGTFTIYGLWYIGYVLWTLGSIAFLIWLLKTLEVM